MWRSYIAERLPDAQFGAPCSEDEITAVEQALGHRLPLVLRDCLHQANGMYDAPHLLGRMVWTTDHMLESNLYYRHEPVFDLDGYRFEEFVMFADDGTGAPFMLPTNSCNQSVYWWYPHDSVVEEVAPDFRTYLDRWIADTL